MGPEAAESGRAAQVRAIMDAFEAIAHAGAFRDSQLWLEADLTMAQMRTLFTISRYAPIPVSGVAQHLGIGMPTASHLVDCLVRAGLAERHTDEVDRRVVHCALSERGSSFMERTGKAHLARMLMRLDADGLRDLRAGVEALTRVALGDSDAPGTGEEGSRRASVSGSPDR